MRTLERIYVKVRLPHPGLKVCMSKKLHRVACSLHTYMQAERKDYVYDVKRGKREAHD